MWQRPLPLLNLHFAPELNKPIIKGYVQIIARLRILFQNIGNAINAQCQ